MDDIKEYKVIHLMYSYFDYNAVIILVSVTSIYSIKLDFSKEKKKGKVIKQNQYVEYWNNIFSVRYRTGTLRKQRNCVHIS